MKNIIHLVRGQRVLLDHDIARLFAVESKDVLDALSSNKKSFEEDSYFQLTKEEWNAIMHETDENNNQSAGQLPYAFNVMGVIVVGMRLQSNVASDFSVAFIEEVVKMHRVLYADGTSEGKAIRDEIARQPAGKFVFNFLNKFTKPDLSSVATNLRVNKPGKKIWRKKRR